MIPGEIICQSGDIEINVGRVSRTLAVTNVGDRPVQVGSHYHFFEVNAALTFERGRALGHRLDIPAGTALRFEPGQQRMVSLIPLSGARRVFGGRAAVMGALEEES